MDFWRFSRADIDPAAVIAGSYDLRLVVLSLVVASLAGYSALEIIERVRAASGRRARLAWLSVGSISMGLGVWAMHFIGMLSFELPIPVNYDLAITGVSVVPAVVASGITIHVLSGALNPLRRVVGGLLMASGIGAMHYTGMEAMRISAELRYAPELFAGSIVVAFLLATIAFWAEARLRVRWATDRFVPLAAGGLILGGAVCGMHYTAMEASVLVAGSASRRVSTLALSPYALSATIVVATSLIVAAVVASAWIDRRIQRDRATIEALEGLLPICAWCKKIRNSEGSWQDVETFISSRSKADFTHSVCADCARDL